MSSYLTAADEGAAAAAAAEAGGAVGGGGGRRRLRRHRARQHCCGGACGCVFALDVMSARVYDGRGRWGLQAAVCRSVRVTRGGCRAGAGEAGVRRPRHSGDQPGGAAVCRQICAERERRHYRHQRNGDGRNPCAPSLTTSRRSPVFACPHSEGRRTWYRCTTTCTTWPCCLCGYTMPAL